MSQPTTQDREKLWDLIKDIKFAMFTTLHSGNGHLHSRPMTTQESKLDEEAAVWFFMSRKSEPVADIAARPQVNVAYANPCKDSYVSLSGEATIVEDMAKKKALWNTGAKAWFPGGVEDADVALVKVAITHADYWDVKDSKVVQLFKIAKAAATGTTPEGMDEHGRVDLR